MKHARKIWRDAIEVVVARLGEAAPPRVLAWYDEETTVRRSKRAQAIERRAAMTPEERRADDRNKTRARRAAMTPEERRAEWTRHQRARRARLRAAQEAVTASHVEAAE